MVRPPPPMHEAHLMAMAAISTNWVDAVIPNCAVDKTVDIELEVEQNAFQGLNGYIHDRILWLRKITEFSTHLERLNSESISQIDTVMQVKEMGSTALARLQSEITDKFQEYDISVDRIKELEGRVYSFETLQLVVSGNVQRHLSKLSDMSPLFDRLDAAIDQFSLKVGQRSESWQAEAVETLQSVRSDLGGNLKSFFGKTLAELERNATNEFETRKKSARSGQVLDTTTLFIKFRTAAFKLRPIFEFVIQRAQKSILGMTESRGYYLTLLKQLISSYVVCRVRILYDPVLLQVQNVINIHMTDGSEDSIALATKQCITLVRNLVIMELQTYAAFFKGVDDSITGPATQTINASFSRTMTETIQNHILSVNSPEVLCEVSDFLEFEIKESTTSPDDPYIHDLWGLHVLVQERLVFFLENQVHETLVINENQVAGWSTAYPIWIYEAIGSDVPSDKDKFTSRFTSGWDDPLEQTISYLGQAFCGLSYPLFERVAVRTLQKLIDIVVIRSTCIHEMTWESAVELYNEKCATDEANSSMISVLERLFCPRERSLHAALYQYRIAQILCSQLSAFDMNMTEFERELDFSSVLERVWSLIAFNGHDNKLRLRDPSTYIPFLSPDVKERFRDVGEDLHQLYHRGLSWSIASALSFIAHGLLTIDERVLDAKIGKLPRPDDMDEQFEGHNNGSHTVKLKDIQEVITNLFDELPEKLCCLFRTVALYVGDRKMTDPIHLTTASFDSLRLTEDCDLGRISSNQLSCLIDLCGEASDGDSLWHDVTPSPIVVDMGNWMMSLHSTLLKTLAKFEVTLRVDMEMTQREMIRVHWIHIRRVHTYIRSLIIELVQIMAKQCP
eukprot:GHVH01004119.1.p1 GENE.GHVH01004119.1~~GHVH01004119.1.p1  ORF type:complete len:856 (+),score=104.81 GHVH01004119.1:26-2569(+)